MVQLPASDLLRGTLQLAGAWINFMLISQGYERATRLKLGPRKRVKAQLSHCHVTPTRTETFFLPKFSEGAILTLCFSLHLDLRLDSALCSRVLCESLTPHALPWPVPCFLMLTSLAWGSTAKSLLAAGRAGDSVPCPPCIPLFPHCVPNLFLYPGILFPKPCISENCLSHIS